MMSQTKAIEVFYSYASEDESLCKELEKHLSNLQRQGIITQWHKHLIPPGAEWEQVLDTRLNTASLILLLISSDFMASDYCHGVEMQRALERHRAKEARVIPILLRPVHWQGAPFGKLQVLPSNAQPVTRWLNRDDAFLDVVEGIQAAIEEMKTFLASNLSSALPHVWNIPYPRNPFFTGRENLLIQLSNTLRVGRTTALGQPQAISGLGGIGKTQIAIEYAYRYHEQYQTVLWAQAETREVLISSFVTIAGLLNLPEKDAQDQTSTITAVFQWMKTHASWLLILDNTDNLDLVKAFIPPAFGGHILLTTRARATGRLAQRIEVETMSPEVGALLLLRRATLISIDASLEHAAASDCQIALKIVQELGGLPLALDQAGAYIEETACSLSDYLDLYRTQRSALLKRRGGLIIDHPEPVATTWSISFNRVEQINPAAADLLRLCAFLYPDAIPEEVITQKGYDLGSQLHTLTVDPLVFNTALEVLGTYSFVKRDTVGHTLSIHRLVQAVLKDEMDDKTFKQWAERAVHAVNESFPHVTFTTWHQCERSLPNAQTCAVLIMQNDMTFPEAAHLLHKTGRYLDERGHYNMADLLLQHALVLREHHLGSEHPNTLMTMNALGSLYHRQGKYAEAESLHMRVLAACERCWGPEHPQTAISLNNLAWLYREQGKYTEAELLLQRALKIRETHMGSEHPDTATTLTDMAWLYHEQGKYTEAESLLQRALAIRKQFQDPEHPALARILNNLALLYFRQEKFAEAEPLYLQALTIRERRFGVEHIATATTLNNLAKLYSAQGEYAKAEELQMKALKTYERLLGFEHIETAKSLNNLAMCYLAQGRYAEAESLLRRSLVIREQQLGPEHPATAITLNNLAKLYSMQGRYTEAESLYVRSLEIRKQGLGTEHPATLATMKDYASLLRKMHREVEAEMLEAQMPLMPP